MLLYIYAQSATKDEIEKEAQRFESEAETYLFKGRQLERLLVREDEIEVKKEEGYIDSIFYIETASFSSRCLTFYYTDGSEETECSGELVQVNDEWRLR